MKKSAENLPEVLAPVGGQEQLYAAVKSGADAVYLGAIGFNARRNAENFTENSFSEAVRYCHIRGVKVYVTLNTLIFDDEYSDMLQTLRLIAQSGADAVIVQDLAVAKAVKEHCPTLALHASTQMAVHNVNGAVMLEKLGFSRIVLARENSLADIKAIRQAVDIELEFFVHGAHCMSASGMCFMSSALGARSGNRGLCAQPCRLNFKTNEREYALSLKDMSLISHLGELTQAGICSLKIEGRMKRPEYVAACVNACRQALNGEVPSLDILKSVFSRSGFTDGYLTGKRNLDMFGTRTKDDVLASQSVLPTLNALYKDERKNVALQMQFEAKNNAPCKLTLDDGINRVCVEGDIPQPALHLSLTEEMAQKSLQKLGATPYYIKNADFSVGEGIMLSAASLNALRRNAVEALNIERAGKPHPFYEEKKQLSAVSAPFDGCHLRLRFEKAEQIPDVPVCERIILPVSQITDALIDKYGTKLVPEIPVLIYPANEEKYAQSLNSLKNKGLIYALCENIGAILLAQNAGFVPLGGMMLNILNSDALKAYYDLGVTDMTLSFEMPFEKMKQLKQAGKTGFIAYGHLPLMRFRCCPMQGKSGCGSCTGKSTLKDRRNEVLTVLCSDKQYSTLHNPIALYTGNMKMPTTDFKTLYFTYETKDECAKIIDCFQKGISFFDRKTSGLYDKELL